MVNKFRNIILNHIIDNILKKTNRNAFYIEDRFYTYREFGLCISKIRNALVKNGIKDKHIGLVVNDSLETYASIIALWLEGKSYVSLHPNQPIDRCIDILNQVGTQVVLDSSETTRYESYNVIATSKLANTSDFYVDDPQGTDEDLAYILFTSGSTGKPKGVMISRLNLAAYVDSFFSLDYALSEEDKCLQCFDLTFDMSVGSYIAPLVKGACIYTVSPNVIKYGKVWELLEEQDITVAHLVPSTIRLLQPYLDEIHLPQLKACYFAGEAVYADLIEQWQQCAPNCVMSNDYGPTENTIYSTHYVYKKGGKTVNGVISIGKPFKHTEAIIIDEDEHVLEDNQKGELCLAGDQLTPGYFNNPAKNNESFFLYQNKRFYKTGDICYRDGDGDYMCFGRKDAQVKIQGFRVELSEIEYHAKEYLKNTSVVCLAIENEQHFTVITLFIEAEQFNTEPLFDYLKSKMPSYMIPATTVFVPCFPLNTSGKTDKVELRKLLK